MLGKERTVGLLEAGLKLSDAEQTEILVVGQDMHLTRYSENYIHQNVGESDYRITVRAVNGKRIGVASGNQFEEGALRETVQAACEMSRIAPENLDFRSLPEPEPIPPVRMGVAAATLECPPDLRAAYVERVVSMAREKSVKAAGALSTGSTELAVANSLGIRAYYLGTRADLSCVVMSADSSGFAQESSVDAALVDPTRVAQKAISKCLASRDPVTVPPGEYDVILEPPAVAGMLLYLAFLGLTGEAYQEGRSFMSGRLDERITGDNISIWDDGLDPAGFPMPFDFEGVPKRKVMLIENGIARGVVYSSMSAGKEGRRSTGHAVAQEGFRGSMPVNLMMAGGTSSIPEMIASTERGILVTRFHYVNPVHPVKAIVTGMTRDGTFLIEGGKVTKGLTNMRFTESILGALSRVERISAERSLEGGMLAIVCPAVKVEGFTFTGATK